MKKPWCIAGRKDAELTSLDSVQSLHVVPFHPSFVRKAEPYVTGLFLLSLPSFLTYFGPQWTAIEEETNEVGEGEGKRAGSDTWEHDSHVVAYNGFDGRL